MLQASESGKEGTGTEFHEKQIKSVLGRRKSQMKGERCGKQGRKVRPALCLLKHLWLLANLLKMKKQVISEDPFTLRLDEIKHAGFC